MFLSELRWLHSWDFGRDIDLIRQCRAYVLPWLCFLVWIAIVSGRIAAAVSGGQVLVLLDDEHPTERVQVSPQNAQLQVEFKADLRKVATSLHRVMPLVDFVSNGFSYSSDEFGAWTSRRLLPRLGLFPGQQ